MGERKGQNMWYPPDYDPRKGGLNKSQGTHALRERARKLHLGILIIRFEMPYNIWCEGCGNHVGMGVRYNAEKKKVGMYYTTPIYLFRMKCHLCNNHFEIKTDPANLDYVIVTGARRQERRWDATKNGQVVPDEKEVGRKLQDDAMFKLEHGSKDVKTAKDAEPTIKKLTAIQDRVKDDYLANSILRAEMRAKRKIEKQRKAVDKALLAKYSLNLELLPQNEADVQKAKLLQLQATESPEQRLLETRESIAEESIFKSKSRPLNVSPSTKEKSKMNFQAMALKHNLERKQAKAESSISLGVKLKSNAKKKDDEELAENFDDAGPSSSSKGSGDIGQNLSLCAYGSTSSESD